MPEIGTVTASTLNLRRSPGGEIIRTLSRGAKVEILEDQEEFLKVAVESQSHGEPPLQVSDSDVTLH